MKNYVREQRVKKNITQEELATIMNVSRQTINAIETNRYLPSIILALKLSRFFELNVNDLFVLEDEI
ncbi:MAG: helix-turn-helix transcriptional regulator [Flavobacteriales bacterium]|nr:helix-turn-helix transcriptional regulator [Flavobacteriales bacterium]